MPGARPGHEFAYKRQEQGEHEAKLGAIFRIKPNAVK
jgi:hypothetical protein